MAPLSDEYPYYPKPKLELYISHFDYDSGEVRFDAHLLGSRWVMVDPTYQCLQEYWSFGDGRFLIKESPCDRHGNPKEGGRKTKILFKETNLYWARGKYTAQLQLLDRNNEAVIKSNKVEIEFRH